MDDGPRRGIRDNGLRCAGYEPVADLDPRIVEALLEALRDHGIAAYAEPTPGTTGGYGERRLPDRPIDRLWVDRLQAVRAREVIGAERAEESAPPEQESTTGDAGTQGSGAEIDFDRAWQDVLASLHASPSSTPAWPASENLAAVRAVDDEPPDEDADGASYDPADEAHFEPPPPPPFPKLRRVTLGALAAIALGLVILATDFAGGSLRPVAILAILVGVGSLVWNMRNGPPTDSGWDDGAVV